jgi:ABC-type glycerol-3-phosphate transport system substrate-binding protein
MMRIPQWPWLAIALALMLVGAAAFLSGCALPSSQPTAVPEVPTDSPSVAEPTAIPTDSPPLAPSVITLTIWTTESFSPTQAITSGLILAEKIDEFESAQPDVRLQFELKKAAGKGGVLDFLRTTQAVVPSLLPDIVELDAVEVRAAAEEGLIQPLDELIPAELAADLYPFAEEAGSVDGQLYGLQYFADLDHLVYNSGRIATPPSAWPGVLSGSGPYVFPAGGLVGLVNDAFLVQYLAVRPWPAGDNSGEPFLDAESLTAVLQYYQDGISRGIFPTEILNHHTTADSWRSYLAGEATLAQVSAHQFLGERAQALNPVAARVPAINGPASPISRGRVLALVTADPIRQSASIEFMTQFMAPETNAAWTQSSYYLPTRQSALPFWDTGDSYSPFIHQQLQAARPRPFIPNYTRVAAALQVAVEDVLTGSATPEQAAAQVIEDSQ